jgi:hypothetical protein
VTGERLRATGRRWQAALVVGGIAAAVGGCTSDDNETGGKLRHAQAHPASQVQAERQKAAATPSANGSSRKHDAHAVSDREVRRLKLGTTLSAVEANLGQPALKDEDGTVVAPPGAQGGPAREATLYYARADGSDGWALSFEYGTLISKTRSNPRAIAQGD